MLQYLLNTTAIWLISLVMFDVFLRRESYHSYNRFYLLFTFLLGAFLPLLHWQQSISGNYPATIAKPLQQVITAKQNIVTATTSSASSINWQLWLTIIYLSGVFVALCLLVIEIIKLSAAYAANTSYADGWKIIETGKEHAPFSFLNTLFVCSRAQYNDEEWLMILTHEKRHISLFHIADLLLMQLARVLFWFHPLVYLYNKRLLLVHEYQADNPSARQPQVYGKFLIEQAILQSAPALSHSFNRSPIKNRILMLTRRSSAAARTKMLVFLPLLFVCFLLFTKNSFSQQSNGDIETITYKGNKFEIEKSTFRGMIPRIDSETKKEVKDSVFNDALPLKMNGKKIYNWNDKALAEPEFIGKEKTIWNYLLDPILSDINQLPDGKYYVSPYTVVIDAGGKLVYYEFNCIYEVNAYGRFKSKHYEFNDVINKEMAALYDNQKIKPAKLNGKVFLVTGMIWAVRGLL